MNWEGCGRKWSLPNIRSHCEFSCTNRNNHKELRTVGVPAKFKISHFKIRVRDITASVN
jgi:hypothetical protein